jgi:hypothetical protein
LSEAALQEARSVVPDFLELELIDPAKIVE